MATAKKTQPGPEKGGSPTIRDVAREARVSVATVSRYLNRSAFINPSTEERVVAAMRKLSYSPDTRARGLATHKTLAIGVMMETIAGDFFAPLLQGIEAETAEAGFGLLTASTSRWKEGQRLPPLGPHNTDGLILLPGSADAETIRRWESSGFPLVLLYEEPPAGLDIMSLRIENEGAVRKAILHLVLVHGRRSIVFLRGQEGHQDSVEREAGYRAALREAGIPFDPALVLRGDYNAEAAEASLLAFMDAGRGAGVGFDAVYAADDDSAFGALRALRARGLRVPEDVAVMGFDDQRYALLSDPPLSTVRAPTELAGRGAARMLLARIRGEEPSDRRIVLSTEIKYRRSCGCAFEKQGGKQNE